MRSIIYVFALLLISALSAQEKVHFDFGSDSIEVNVGESKEVVIKLLDDKNKLVDNHSQFIACSGRLNFELVQKGLMSNIAVMAGVGAPTSLAIDLAKRFNMTLIGFVKKTSFNIYTNKNRIIL